MSEDIRWVIVKNNGEETLPSATYLDAWLQYAGCTNQSVEEFWAAVKRLEKDGYQAVTKNYGEKL
jgi:hypothetical protein